LLSAFCSSPPAAHRDLHSFPTRRSSDLPLDVPACRGQYVVPCRAEADGVGLLGAGDEARRRGRRNPQQLLDPCSRGLLRGNGSGDRKSTRLNSSHVKISYAVFCLKKKKE